MSFAWFRFLLLFFIIIAFSSLQAAFVDHLKKAEGKSDDYKMDEIDFIYVINLDRRTEKFQQTLEELTPYGIYPYRFSAVDGWTLSVEAIQEVGLAYQPGMVPLFATTYPIEGGGMLMSHEYMRECGKTYFGHCMPKGAIGCALSHISILKDAWDSGYKTIWVMEDDIEVLKDPHMISSLIQELDRLVGESGWDVLFTDRDYRTGIDSYLPALGAQKRPDLDCSLETRYCAKYTTNRQIHPHFKEVSARFGTHSMIIRRSGIEKLLDFSLSHHIYLPYDLENYLPLTLKRYSFTFDVVTNRLGALSDIGGAGSH